MPELYLQALSYTATTFWPWPPWLLAGTAVVLAWRRGREDAAVHLLVLAWHLALVLEVASWSQFFFGFG